MARDRSLRAGLAGFAFVATAFAALLSGAVAPELARETEAQVQTGPVQPPPAVGEGLPADAGAIGSDLAPATPVPPANPANATTIGGIVDSGGSVTTSLGGSDVAVSSVGGSYEVDGPKRRAKRAPKMAPEP